MPYKPGSYGSSPFDTGEGQPGFKSEWQGPWQVTPRRMFYELGVPGENMRRMLEEQARGEGPSLGRGMMQEGLQQAIKNQRAQAAGMMGTNPALAMKLSGEQAGAMTAQNLRDVGQVGLQEQMAAQQALRAWLQAERLAQMQFERDRMAQEGSYQQALLGYNQQRQKQKSELMGDILGMAGTGLGFALGGPMGGAAGSALGGGISPNDPIWGGY